jgi:hypothetical protein
MKTILRLFSATLLLGALFFASTARAAQIPAERKLARLDDLVHLSAGQRAPALALFTKENAVLDGLAPEDRIEKGTEIRQATRDGVRALLTPAQQAKYDRAPQSQGGGLMLPTPEARVARLAESTGGLTARQKEVALQVYTEEFESLLALPPAERMSKGMPYRKAATEQIQMLLNPGQQTKAAETKAAVTAVETAERRAVENFLRNSPALATRVGEVQRLEPDGNSIISDTTMSTSVVGSAAPTMVAAGERRGKFIYKVYGANGTETVSVSWAKATPAAELKVVKIENSKGEALRL